FRDLRRGPGGQVGGALRCAGLAPAALAHAPGTRLGAAQLPAAAQAVAGLGGGGAGGHRCLPCGFCTYKNRVSVSTVQGGQESFCKYSPRGCREVQMRSRKYMCDDQTVARPATGQTPVRNLRVANDVWLPALAAARDSGSTLTDVITQFLRWYL